MADLLKQDDLDDLTGDNSLFQELNEKLKTINVEKAYEEKDKTTSFEDLPEGYYLCEVTTAALEPNKAHTNMQVKLTLKVVEDGLKAEINDRGYAVLVPCEKSKGRLIFKYYPLTTEINIENYIKDMAKFEGKEAGVPLLESECFTNSELIKEALAILIGMRIYVHLRTSTKSNGETNTWKDLISWSRAKDLELPL